MDEPCRGFAAAERAVDAAVFGDLTGQEQAITVGVRRRYELRVPGCENCEWVCGGSDVLSSSMATSRAGASATSRAGASARRAAQHQDVGVGLTRGSKGSGQVRSAQARLEHRDVGGSAAHPARPPGGGVLQRPARVRPQRRPVGLRRDPDQATPGPPDATGRAHPSRAPPGHDCRARPPAERERVSSREPKGPCA